MYYIPFILLVGCVVAPLGLSSPSIANGWQRETSPPKCGADIYHDVFIEKTLSDGTLEYICGECKPSAETPSDSAHAIAHPYVHYVLTGKSECKGYGSANGEEAPTVGQNAIDSVEKCATACFSHFDNDPGQHGFIYGSISVGGTTYCYCEKGSVGGDEANNDSLEPCEEQPNSLFVRYEYTSACAPLATSPSPVSPPTTSPSPKDSNGTTTSEDSECETPIILWVVIWVLILAWLERHRKVSELESSQTYEPVTDSIN